MAGAGRGVGAGRDVCRLPGGGGSPDPSVGCARGSRGADLRRRLDGARVGQELGSHGVSVEPDRKRLDIFRSDDSSHGPDRHLRSRAADRGAAAMPAALTAGGHRGKSAVFAVFCAIALLAATWIGGTARLAGAAPDVVGDVRLRLVQPNIDQKLKWKRPLLDEHLLKQANMGARPAADAPTHVIWSETAAPLFLGEDRDRLRVIGDLTPPGGLTITGTLRRTPPGVPFRLWNSLLALDHGGMPVATFDKSHLVPFGEYVPFRNLLNLAKVTSGAVDFSPGEGVQTLRLPGLPPVSPLICYEVIFPGQVVDPADRPEWMLNITNDAWYGQSTGPYQHLAMARLRAVEEGLPLVRVANTGISAIIDPWGRVLARLGLGEQGVIDGPLPAALATQPVYARFGNWMVLLVVAAAVSTALLLSRRE